MIYRLTDRIDITRSKFFYVLENKKKVKHKDTSSMNVIPSTYFSFIFVLKLSLALKFEKYIQQESNGCLYFLCK